jgi:hypothetical protein
MVGKDAAILSFVTSPTNRRTPTRAAEPTPPPANADQRAPSNPSDNRPREIRWPPAGTQRQFGRKAAVAAVAPCHTCREGPNESAGFSRTTGILIGRWVPAIHFCSGPAANRSSRTDLVAAAATNRKSAQSLGFHALRTFCGPDAHRTEVPPRLDDAATGAFIAKASALAPKYRTELLLGERKP